MYRGEEKSDRNFFWRYFEQNVPRKVYNFDEDPFFSWSTKGILIEYEAICVLFPASCEIYEGILKSIEIQLK